MTFRLWYPTLRDARTGWLDRADEVDEAARDLDRSEWTLLGRRVAAAAEAFGSTWVGELRSLRDAAEVNAGAIGSVLDDALATDRDTVQRMQRLMPWQDRDVTPVQPGPGGVV